MRKHTYIIGIMGTTGYRKDDLVHMHIVFDSLYLDAHISFCEEFLCRKEIYENKDLDFLRDSFKQIKEPLLKLQKLVRGNPSKNILRYDDQTWIDTLNIDKYSSSFNIAKEACESPVKYRVCNGITIKDRPYGITTMMEAYIKESSKRVYIPLSSEKDIPNLIKNTFFFFFGFMEPISSNREYSPVNILMNSYFFKKQGVKVDLTDLILDHFDDFEQIFKETEAIFYDTRIWYKRKGFFLKYFGQNEMGYCGSHCLVDTQHILTIYKLRFISLCIVTYILRKY